MTQQIANLVRLGATMGVGYILALAVSLGLPHMSSSVRDAIIGGITALAMVPVNAALNAIARRFPWIRSLLASRPAASRG